MQKCTSSNGKVLATFIIPASIWAERINLVGDFNNWDTNNLPFVRTRHDVWQIEIELEAGREYRFKYLFDGEHWRDEWQADKYVPNIYGGYDSVIIT